MNSVKSLEIIENLTVNLLQMIKQIFSFNVSLFFFSLSQIDLNFYFTKKKNTIINLFQVFGKIYFGICVFVGIFFSNYYFLVLKAFTFMGKTNYFPF